VVWLLLMAAESIQGALRAIVLVPIAGDFRARQIGAITGSFIVLALACLLIDWVGARGPGRLLAVGLFWLVLTLGFEFGLGRYGFGYSWQHILEDYDIRRGGLLAFGMVVLTLSPMIAVWLRHPRASA
jgi:hypothetical protein